MRISDWSSDVCSSDLDATEAVDLDAVPALDVLDDAQHRTARLFIANRRGVDQPAGSEIDIEPIATRRTPMTVRGSPHRGLADREVERRHAIGGARQRPPGDEQGGNAFRRQQRRSEEHTSELQSLLRKS